MTEVLDALLPWLVGQQPLQWGALALMIATVLAGWLATYLAVVKELDPALGAVAATVSVAFGVGGLALGRYLVVQLGAYTATLPPPGEQASSEGGHALGGIVLFIGMAAVGALLLMGLGLSMVLDGPGILTRSGTYAFRTLSGAGLALWLAHEVTLITIIAHNGWPLAG